MAVSVVAEAANHSEAAKAARPGEAIAGVSAPLGVASWDGAEALSAAGHEVESSESGRCTAWPLGMNFFFFFVLRIAQTAFAS